MLRTNMIGVSTETPQGTSVASRAGGDAAQPSIDAPRATRFGGHTSNDFGRGAVHPANVDGTCAGREV